MKRLLVLTLALALLAAVGWQAISGAQGAALSDDEVTAIVREFVGRPDLTLAFRSLQDEARPGSERTCQTPDGKAVFVVDLQRREVVIASMPDFAQESGQRVTRDQALQTAHAFAVARVKGVENLALVRDTLDDHGGAGGQQFTFLWTAQLGSQKALGLQRISVSADAASGSVVSFMQIPPMPITVNAEPTVSREEAVAIASERFGAPVKASTAELDVWWKGNDRAQPQILRWRVTLESDQPLFSGEVGDGFIPAHAAYVIDAHTGEVLETMH